jgi:hypothetical protein
MGRMAACAFFDDIPLLPVDFQGLATSGLLKGWQGKWDASYSSTLV